MWRRGGGAGGVFPRSVRSRNKKWASIRQKGVRSKDRMSQEGKKGKGGMHEEEYIDLTFGHKRPSCRGKRENRERLTEP